MISTLAAAGLAVHVWRLDGALPLPPGLRDGGHGPGAKFDLVRRLASGCDPSSDLVVIDDDVVFCRGDVGTFVGIARKAGLALAQPSHTFASYSSHALTVARPLSTARRTSFVEIGPVTFFRSDSRERLLAPEVAPAMGYGTEIRWREIAQRDGLAMGIVDAVRIRHLRRVGIGYDVRGQWARTNEMLAAAGAASWADFQQVLAVWRPWRRTAPWAEERRP